MAERKPKAGLHNRVNQAARTLGCIVLLTRELVPNVSLSSLIQLGHFDIIVNIGKKLSTELKQLWGCFDCSRSTAVLYVHWLQMHQYPFSARGSAPDPAGGAYDASPDPLVGWRGVPSPYPSFLGVSISSPCYRLLGGPINNKVLDTPMLVGRRGPE